MAGPQNANVRALERGLAILREVSRSRGIAPGPLAARLKLPRPTVYRLLETLETLGYVARSASDNRFRVTLLARGIAEGYDDETRIGEIAGPILAEIGRELVWPIDLTTYEDGAMIVRETTHPRSPLSVDRNMVGVRLPMLRTAAGRAWLTFAPAAERAACLALLALRDDPDDRPFLESEMLENMLSACRRHGLGMRLGEPYVPKTSSFAAPVLTRDGVAGCIALIWITTAVPVAEARARFAAPLRAAAARIAEALDGAQAAARMT